MLPVHFEERQGALVVTPLAGRLDASVAPDFREQVSARAAGRRLVVLSLEHVVVVDASGLAALISVVRDLAPGGELRLAHASPRVRELLASIRLEGTSAGDAAPGPP